MKKIFLFLLFLLLSVSGFAFRIEWGKKVNINQPVYEDLYIFGGTITINAPIYGDLIIAGGNIHINDSVMYDILLAGGNVTFNGYVGDDIRCAGGQLYVFKNIGGDLVITGGEVIVNKGVVIEGGLLVSGGDITFSGTVKNNVKAAVGELFFDGIAEKNIDIRGGKIEMDGNIMGISVLAARDIKVGRNAVFQGNVRYWNKQGSLDFKQSMKNGTATYDPSLRLRTARWYYLGAATVLGMLWYLGMALLMIMIIQYLFSTTMSKAGDTVFNHSLKSLGVGFLFFIAVPVAAVVAFITVIGVPVGLILLFGYIALVLLATVITSTVVSNWLNNRNNYNWGYWKIVFSAFGVFVLLKLTTMVPFAGWLIMILMACMAFGGIFLNVNWKRNQRVGIT
jgi:hypothetical protein